MNRLEKKIAIVTGAASGIGQAIAVRFALEGATVIACDMADLSHLADEIKNVHTFDCDVTVPEQVQAMFAECKSRFGRLDILCNNAGIVRVGPSLHELELKDFDAVMNVNLRGAFVVMQEAIRLMLEAGSGSIVNTASIGGFKAVRNMGSYCASKAGVILLTRQAALEYAPHNIRVNAVCPGTTNTAIIDHSKPDLLEAVIRTIPRGRLGMPEEIANAALFLASDEASFVTGECLVVDGARSIN